MRLQEINHARKIHSCVVNPNIKGAPQVDPFITASWERCLKHYGINPSDPKPVEVLTVSELREHRRSIEHFIFIAKTEAHHLYRQVANLGYSTMLCNAGGIIVDLLGNDQFSKQWKDAGVHPGAVWSEHQAGTCGVGTALIEQVPLTVHKNEHFRFRNTNLTESCAPIIPQNGQFLGFIGISALHSPDSKNSQYLALQLVIQSARIIEKAYFLSQFKDYWILKLSFEREMAEVSSECLIALEGDGRIIAADRVADRTLALEIGCDSLSGRNLDEVFDTDFEKLQTMTAKSSLVLPIRTQNKGRQMFASLRPPQAKSNKPPCQTKETVQTKRNMPLQGEPLSLDYLAGEDPKLQDIVERIKRVMNKPIPVLLEGATGTGKEMFARAIHNASRRASKPFVAVNCAAIPESLIESELFGYKEGAFTGARSKGMRGKILQSDGGTLFLDEIGDMPVSLQPRLLRVLAEREVTPLGSEAAIPVDLKIICATHCNIFEMVAEGRFREDLYYRLNGIAFELPTLKQRSDIAHLINDILMIEAKNGAESPVINDEAMQVMSKFSWPGNIRQLRNALRYALAVCDKGLITLADLPVDIIPSKDSKAQPLASLFSKIAEALPETKETKTPSSGANNFERFIAGLNAKELAERQVILEVLQKHKWQVSKAVKDVGISRATMYRKMNKYVIIQPNKR